MKHDEKSEYTELDLADLEKVTGGTGPAVVFGANSTSGGSGGLVKRPVVPGGGGDVPKIDLSGLGGLREEPMMCW